MKRATEFWISVARAFNLNQEDSAGSPSKQSTMKLRVDKDITVRNRNCETMSEEERYHSLIKFGFRVLAPFYDAMTVLLFYLYPESFSSGYFNYI